MAQVRRRGTNVTKPGKSCAGIQDPAARAACMKRAKNKVIDQGTPNVPGRMASRKRNRQY